MYDVIVVGAGPAGASSAAIMAADGLRVLVLDKASFPRDKTCGDAISGKSVDVLKQLGLIDRIRESASLDSWGILFSAPSGDKVEIPFTRELNRPVPPGFLCARTVFDQILVENAIEKGAEVRQQVSVEKLIQEDGRVLGVVAKDDRTSEVSEIRAPITIGADGAYSVVTRQLGMAQMNEDHYFAAVRAYFEGVTGFHERNYIELHFVDEALPGYFWIFPMPNGQANIGVGALSRDIKERGLKMKQLLEILIEHPRFKDRFKNARRLTPTEGWGLPLGSKPRKMAGDGWMLVGDAASLIDPFTGEGIGNALVSGSRAAAWVRKSTDAADVSATFLQGYEAEVLKVLSSELRLSYWMQLLMARRWPLNMVIRKASRSTELADLISSMFDDLGQRKKLVSPLFYLRLLTA